jgi:multidrug efflux pump subunit AcrB
VVAYNAASVPVLQLILSSDRLNEQQLYNYGIYNLRQQFAPVHGVTFPTSAGGKYRQIMVDIDSTKARGQRAPPADVVNAVNAQTLTLPSGLVKIGDMQYTLCTGTARPSCERIGEACGPLGAQSILVESSMRRWMTRAAPTSRLSPFLAQADAVAAAVRPLATWRRLQVRAGSAEPRARALGMTSEFERS